MLIDEMRVAIATNQGWTEVHADGFGNVYGNWVVGDVTTLADAQVPNYPLSTDAILEAARNKFCTPELAAKFEHHLDYQRQVTNKQHTWQLTAYEISEAYLGTANLWKET